VDARQQVLVPLSAEMRMTLRQGDMANAQATGSLRHLQLDMGRQAALWLEAEGSGKLCRAEGSQARDRELL